MKRRSARPFMVEVKHARTPRAALKDPEPQARPSKVLWPELAQAEPKPLPPVPEAAPAPRPEPKEPDAPVRRVLPNLMPMFQSTGEPEPDPEIEAPTRRARTRREGGPAAARTVRKAMPVEPAPEIRPAAIRPEMIAATGSTPVATGPAESEQGMAPRPAAWRRTKELRLGERWKRRLPPYLR